MRGSLVLRTLVHWVAVRRAARGLAAAMAVATLLAGCATESGELRVVPADQDEYDYEYRIPAGTAASLDAGEEVEIVPEELDVKVGERIRVINDDVRGAAVGIFWVPAGRRVAMEFTTTGTLTGECYVHPNGEFTINVT
jgi:hypothetical protein